MKTPLLFLVCFLVSTFFYSQVGIGTVTPEASSILDVTASDKGFIAPRVSLLNVANNVNPISAPVEGLLVYNTNASVTGGSGTGYYYWNGTQWTKLITPSAIDDWKLTGNSSTNPTTNFVGTTDNRDLVFRTNNTEEMRIESGGNVGIGNNNPSYTLDVEGDFRINGDFINQQILGTHSGTVQSVPFTNLAFNPLTGTVNSITITDGNGVNNSAVFIIGFARVFGGSLSAGTGTGYGGYFMVLERDTNASFTTSSILTYTSGVCYLKTATGASGFAVGFGGSGHISYLDSGLTAGVTYYYRLTLVPNSVGVTSGTFEVYQRDLVVMQLKR
ncbi:MAG: hypothetical protein KDC91_06930 [Flavobacteriaceae bacterium]|nr:hypothetical protein [Flavobacteriaceae bacterium]